MKVYLSVPYSEKEAAKGLGAKWDSSRKKWYAPKGEKQLVERWPLNDSPIQGLKGEDRSYGGSQLFVDLVPRSCWFTNVRSCVHFSDWDRLRRFIYDRAGSKCECCGFRGRLDAHERWDFDNTTKVQKLMRIIALCQACHEVTHMGLAQVKGREEVATQHLIGVTGMNRVDAVRHIRDAFDRWRERNRYEWDLDLSIITDSGIGLARKVEKQQRKAIAEENILQISEIQADSVGDYFQEICQDPSADEFLFDEPVERHSISYASSLKTGSVSASKNFFSRIKSFFRRG